MCDGNSNYACFQSSRIELVRDQSYSGLFNVAYLQKSILTIALPISYRLSPEIGYVGEKEKNS